MAAGKIETVLGPITPNQLGRTLTHEHIRMNYEHMFVEPQTDAGKKKARDGRIALDNLGWVRQNPYSHVFNLNLSNESLETMIKEIKKFKDCGGSSIVEATTNGIYPDWEFLKEISEATGVHIIAGAGYYLDSGLTDDVKSASIEDLTKEIVKEVQEGRNGIKAGIIGEIGCSYPLTDAERKSLIAGSKAQAQTGAPLLIHPGRDSKSPFEIMEIIKENGGDCNKTTMSHLDRTVFDYNELLDLANTGCYLEHDFFGIETSHYQYNPDVDFLSDAQRIQRIKFLAEKGYEDKLVIAHDIHTKHRLVKYGGHGYAHILENAIPKMLQRGITQEQLNKILIENPKRWLAF